MVYCMLLLRQRTAVYRIVKTTLEILELDPKVCSSSMAASGFSLVYL